MFKKHRRQISLCLAQFPCTPVRLQYQPLSGTPAMAKAQTVTFCQQLFSVASPALEFKTEGFVYGTAASVIYGLILWACSQLAA